MTQSAMHEAGMAWSKKHPSRRRTGGAARDVLTNVSLIHHSSEAMLQAMTQHGENSVRGGIHRPACRVHASTDYVSLGIAHVIHTLRTTLRVLGTSTTTTHNNNTAAETLRDALRQLLHVWDQMRTAARRTTHHTTRDDCTRRCRVLQQQVMILCAQITHGGGVQAARQGMRSVFRKYQTNTVAVPRLTLSGARRATQSEKHASTIEASAAKLHVPCQALCPLLVLHVKEMHKVCNMQQLITRSSLVFLSESARSCLSVEAAEMCSVNRPAVELLTCDVEYKNKCVTSDMLCRLLLVSSGVRHAYMALMHVLPLHGSHDAQWRTFLCTQGTDCRRGCLVLVFLLYDATRHRTKAAAYKGTQCDSAQTCRDEGRKATTSPAQGNVSRQQQQQPSEAWSGATVRRVGNATAATTEEKVTDDATRGRPAVACVGQPSCSSNVTELLAGEAAFPAAGMTSTRGHIVDNVTPDSLAARLRSLGAITTLLLSPALPAHFMMNLLPFMAFAQVLVRQQRAMGIGEVACFVNVRARTFLVADLIPVLDLVPDTESCTDHRDKTAQGRRSDEDTQDDTRSACARRAMRALEAYYADAEGPLCIGTAVPYGDQQVSSSSHGCCSSSSFSFVSSSITASSKTISCAKMMPPPPPSAWSDGLFRHLRQRSSVRKDDTAPLPLSHHTASAPVTDERDARPADDAEGREPHRKTVCGCDAQSSALASPDSRPRSGYTNDCAEHDATACRDAQNEDTVPLETFLDADMIAHLHACEAALWLRRGGAATLVFPFITRQRLALLAQRNGGNLDGGKNLLFYGIPLANALTETLVPQCEGETTKNEAPMVTATSSEANLNDAVAAAAKESDEPATPPSTVIATQPAAVCASLEVSSPSASHATLSCSPYAPVPCAGPFLGGDATNTPAAAATPVQETRASDVASLPAVLPAAATVADTASPQPTKGSTAAHADGMSSAEGTAASSKGNSGSSATLSQKSKRDDESSRSRRRVMPLFAGYELPRGVSVALASCTQALRHSHLRSTTTPSTSTSQQRSSQSRHLQVKKSTDSHSSHSTTTTHAHTAATASDDKSGDAEQRSGHSGTDDDALDVDESDTVAVAELNSAAVSLSSAEKPFRLHVLVYATAAQPVVEETLMAQGHCVTTVTTATKMLAYLRVGLTPFDIVVVEWCAALVTDDVRHMLRHRICDGDRGSGRQSDVGGTVMVYHCHPDCPLPLPCDEGEETVVRRGTDFTRTAIESCTMRRTQRCIRRATLLRTLACQRVTQSLEIVRQLGSGACGDVFEVYLFASKGRLAMKRIFLKDASLHLLELLHREVALMRVMDHPNIIAFSHTLLDESAFSICMELADGTLAQRIANPALTLAWRPRSEGDMAALPQAARDGGRAVCRVIAPRTSGGEGNCSSSNNGDGESGDALQRSRTHKASSSGTTKTTTTTTVSRISAQEAVLIIRDIASGIAYLHHKGIIHRDIKPQNILFVNGVAKIADFGSAVRVSGPNVHRLAEMKGTLLYMAPEVLLGEAYGAPCDLWSFGCLIADIMGIRFGHLHGLHVPALIELYRSIPATQSLPITITAHTDVGLDTPRSRDATREVLEALQSAANCVSGENVSHSHNRTSHQAEIVGASPLSPDCDPVTSTSSSLGGSNALRSVTCLHTSRAAGLKTASALLPASLVELFEQLFHRDPARRMTIDALLEHPVAWDVEWMTEMMTAVQGMVNTLTQLTAEEVKDSARTANDSMSFSLSLMHAGNDNSSSTRTEQTATSPAAADAKSAQAA